MDEVTGRPRRPRRIWERTRGEKLSDWVWGLLPFVMLLLPTVGMLLRPEPLGGKLLTLAIAVGAAAWYGFMIFLHEEWLERTAPMLLYYAVQLGLLWLLISRDPWYAFFYFVLMFHAFILPGLWAVAGVTATVLMGFATGYVNNPGPGATLADTALNLLASIAFTLLMGLTIRASIDQSDRRRQALEELDKAHEQLEASMAENAGLQRQLLNQAREAGVLDERARLAREIHDTIAQGLTGVITQLEAAERTVTDDGTRQHLDSARSLARGSLSEARRSVEALRPQPLEAARLPEAVADVVTRWAETSNVKADVTTTGTVVAMHPEVEVTLLRVAQEALANVAKHAHATRVGLTLSYMEDQVTLDVRDDGTGFDTSTLQAGGTRPGGGGFGLTAMRQRLARLAGTLEIESAPGEGTAISATVPAIPAGSPSPTGGSA